MTLFIILFFLLLLMVACAGLLILVLPLALGVGIILFANAIFYIKRGKFLPAVWNWLSAIPVIAATGLMWYDVANDSVKFGGLPLLILLVCGVVMLISVAIVKKAAPAPKDETPPVRKEQDWKLQETWEDYPVPNYDACHTYCSVALDMSGRTFYYRTRNPELKVGDRVYVPVGRSYEKTVGIIVGMQNVTAEEIPYPLEKTKFILGKADEKSPGS